MIRSFELRLNPTKAQCAAFDEILVDSCNTYNAALQARRDAWEVNRERITYNHQCHQLAELRKIPQMATIASEIQREPLRRLDRAFKAFFRRCKSPGEKPGYPRFRSRLRYDSFAWSAPRIHGDSLLVPNLGHVKFRAHRQLEGNLKQVTVKRLGQKWIVRAICDIGPAPAKCVASNPVGIDLGLTTFATLSDGNEIQNPRFIKHHSERIARAQRNLARKNRGSNNRLRAKERVRRAYQQMADARKNFCHHVSKDLVGRYDLIAHEDLKIRNMVKGNFAKSILDAAWGQLIQQLIYKAEYAGKWVIPVNPKGTTQRCSRCDTVVPKGIADRWHKCPNCGLSMGRDLNAALNVLKLAPGRGVVDVMAEGTK